MRRIPKHFQNYNTPSCNPLNVIVYLTTKTLNISRSKIFYREKLIYLAWKAYFEPTDVSFFVLSDIFTNLIIFFFSFLLHEWILFQFSSRKRKCFTVAFQRYHIYWLRPGIYQMREKNQKSVIRFRMDFSFIPRGQYIYYISNAK